MTFFLLQRFSNALVPKLLDGWKTTFRLFSGAMLVSGAILLLVF